MLSALLLSALAVSVTAHPTKRQDLGPTPGFLISFTTGSPGPYQVENLCLATNPDGATGLGNGTPLGFVPCTSVQTQSPTQPFYGLWNIQYGNQLGIQLVGTNFCLDAGSNPGSSPSAPGKVWTCYPGLAQQQFYYTGDKHIAVTGYTPCLDSTLSGAATFVQCGSNTNNGDIQAFTITAVGGSGSSSSASASASASASTSASASASASSSSSSPTSALIYWANGGDFSQCLTVTNGQYYDGSPVGIAQCATGQANQQWVFSFPGITTVQVAGQNYCLDFGTGGGYNGVPMKIWQCYPGLFQQTMYYTPDDHIAVYNGNQCLDVEAGTSNVQVWQCSGPDVHQHFAPSGGVYGP